MDSCKYVSELRLQSYLSGEKNILMLNKLKQQTNLQNLEICFQSNRNDCMYNQDICQIFKAIKQFQYLKHLSFLFWENRQVIDEEGLRQMGKLIQSLTNISSLKLSFGRNNVLCFPGMNEIQLGFRKLTNLRQLEIKLYGNNIYSQNSIQALGLGLGSLSNLTHFKFYFISNMIEKEQVVCLIEGMRKLKNLVVLFLATRLCQFDNPICDLISECLEVYQELEDLSLDFNQQQYEINSYINLTKSISKLPKLKKFNSIFDFSSSIEPLINVNNQFNKADYSIYKDNEEGYRKQIQEFNQLRNMKLIFNFSQVDVFMSIKFGNALRQFCFLQNLEINLISKTSIYEIARELGKALQNLTQLISLKMIFGENTDIQFGGAAKLGKGISKLINLKILFLEFQKGNYIGEDGSRAIGQSFSNLTNLKELTFKIFKFNYVGKEGIASLQQSFTQLKNLEILNFLLINDNDMKNLETHNFGDALSFLSNLKKLKFNLQSKIFNILGLQPIANSFNSFPNLIQLSIKLIGETSAKGLIALSDGLTSLKIIEQLELDIQPQNECFSSVDKLAQQISNLQSLKELQINLNFYLTKSKFKKIIQYFNQSQLIFFNLNYLCFGNDFSSFAKLKIYKTFKYLVNLQINPNPNTRTQEEQIQNFELIQNSRSDITSPDLSFYTDSESQEYTMIDSFQEEQFEEEKDLSEQNEEQEEESHLSCSAEYSNEDEDDE